VLAGLPESVPGLTLNVSAHRENWTPLALRGGAIPRRFEIEFANPRRRRTMHAGAVA